MEAKWSSLIKPSDITSPFWDACCQHVLLLPLCKDCHRNFFPPEFACLHCGSQNWHWVTSEGIGTLYSFTEIQRAPVPWMTAPFVLIALELNEGCIVFSQTKDVALESLQIGMEMRVVFDAVSENVVLPKFSV